MLKLEELTRGTSVTGLDPSGPVSIVAVDHIGTDAATVWYKSSEAHPQNACCSARTRPS